MSNNSWPITIDGVTHSLSAWARIAGMSKTTVRNRLMAGWEPRRAVFADAVLNGRLVRKARRPLPPPTPRGISTFPMGAVRSFPLYTLDVLRRLA